MKTWRFYIVCGFMMLLPLVMHAQQFSVTDFHKIPNDLTAFHTPVFDLNHDACALIKVVCTADYVFDSPLGVVKRVDEVGEVWLYLPQGSMMITIRHPQWGVLRDYELGEELISNITYEMIISSPQLLADEPNSSIPADSVLVIQETSFDKPMLEEVPITQPSKVRKVSFLAMGLVGISNRLSYGIRLGVLGKHGAYLMAQSDFKSTPSTAGECNSNGALSNGAGTPYYNGEVKRSLLKVMAGGMHRLVKGLHLYEGIGYGNYSVVWGTTNGINYENKDDSAIGLSAEVGALYRLGSVVLSIGGSTIMAKQWEANAGIGICF